MGQLTKTAKVLGGILTSLWISTACGGHIIISPLPPKSGVVVSLPNRPPISAVNAGSIAEVNLVDTGAGHAIAALDVNDANNIMAVAQDGTIVRWSLSTPAQILTNTVGPVSLRATVVNAAHSILVSAADHPARESPDKTYYIWENPIWDLKSSGIVTKVQDVDGPLTSVALTPDAKWLVAIPGDRHLVYEVSTGRKTAQQAMFYSVEVHVNRVEAMAFDDVGEYVAIANANNAVYIRKLHSTGGFAETKGGLLLAHPIEGNETRMEIQPHALAFNSTRTHLALLRNNGITVFSLAKWEPTFQAPTLGYGSAGALAFHPDGDLLAVGTQHGWQIWDVAHNIKLVERQGDGSYALAFSADGRAFVWGDLQGRIHVWAVK